MVDSEFKSEVVAGARQGIEKLTKLINKIDVDAIDVTDPKQIMNLCNSYSGLTKAYCDLMREDRERQSLLSQVADQMKIEIRGILERQPDLIQAVHAAIEQGKDNLVDRADGHEPTLEAAGAATVGQKYRQRQSRKTKTLALPAK